MARSIRLKDQGFVSIPCDIGPVTWRVASHADKTLRTTRATRVRSSTT